MGYAYMNQSCPCPSQPAQSSMMQPAMARTCTPQAQTAQPSMAWTATAPATTTQPSRTQAATNQSAMMPSQASMPSYGYDVYCPNTTAGGMEQYPVGMGYVPWQQWQQTYPLEQGFNRGTIFPDLDLPFVMGRCVRS